MDHCCICRNFYRKNILKKIKKKPQDCPGTALFHYASTHCTHCSKMLGRYLQEQEQNKSQPQTNWCYWAVQERCSWKANTRTRHHSLESLRTYKRTSEEQHKAASHSGATYTHCFSSTRTKTIDTKTCTSSTIYLTGIHSHVISECARMHH